VTKTAHVAKRAEMNTEIRTFMLGWEFPPFISGGLGTACYGLTKAMDRLGMQVVFVLPKTAPIRFGKAAAPKKQNGYNFTNIQFHTIASSLRPYTQPGQSEYAQASAAKYAWDKAGAKQNRPPGLVESDIYGPDIFNAVHRYAEEAAKIALGEEFDIIHAHDWMTYPAAIAVADATGKPLAVQIHSTEFDRSGENVNQMVYDIERRGMHRADKVIAVSNYTRNIVISRYAVPPEKVEVVYNGVEFEQPADFPAQTLPAKKDKIVLFLGRITMQKGPEYFLQAAKRVLEKIGNVKFIMAGTGDMLYRSVEMAASLGIGHKVLFTRFLTGADVDRAYKMADLYVMPSVSEPFGITPLEALRNGVPVLISKQSGISEVLQNALKVDFWDISQMANKIVAVLNRPPLHNVLRNNGSTEVHKFRWEDSAARMNQIYERTLEKVHAV
jgi:glycosyltransferase involved in cell wall biosynthesis